MAKLAKMAILVVMAWLIMATDIVNIESGIEKDAWV